MKAKLLVFILIVLVLVKLSTEKKNKNSKNRKPKDPKSRRPEKVSAELFCDSCQAILIEAMKKLRGKKKESDILDIMSDVCQQDKYNVYRKYSIHNVYYRLSST